MASKPARKIADKRARTSAATAQTHIPAPFVADTSNYRRIALSLPGAVESAHMGAPDFRVDGRIFATLAYGRKGFGTLKLTLEQQAAFLADGPEYFSPAPGGWGRMGMTLVRVDAPEDVLAGALSTAHRQVASGNAAAKTRRAAGKRSAVKAATS